MNLHDRREKIVELLNENEIMTGEDLGFILNVSSRTIRNDIRHINSILGEELVLSTKGKGYSLIGDDPKKYIKKIHDSENSWYLDRNLVMREILMHSFLGSELIFEELIDMCYMSENIVRAYFNECVRLLNINDIAVWIRKDRTVEISGNEIALRSFYYTYLVSNHTEEVLSRLDDEVSEAYQMVDCWIITLAKKGTIRINYKELNELRKYILISYVRFNVLNKEVKVIVQEMPQNVRLEMDKFELTSGIKLETVYVGALISILSNSEIKIIQDESEIKLNIYETLLSMGGSNSFDFTQDLILMDGLLIHLLVLLQRSQFKVSVKNDLLEVIKVNYPYAFELAIQFSEIFSKKFNVDINEDEIGYLAIHFGSAIEREKSNHHSDTSQIAIVCEHGLSISFLIKEKLLAYFKKGINIVFMGPLKDLNQSGVSYDYIITTSDALEGKNVITINPILTDRDIRKIESRVRKGEMNFDFDVFMHLFQEEVFVKSVSGDTSKDILETITDDMVTKGFIDLEAKERIISRESLSPTDVGGLVAIPHTLNSDSLSSVVGIYRLENPIRWSNEFVQLIVVMVINRDDVGLWELYFERIHRYFIEGFGSKNLINNFSYDFFRKDISDIERRSQ